MPKGESVGRVGGWSMPLALLLLGCVEPRQADAGYPMVGGPAAVLSEELRIDGWAEQLVPIRRIAVSDQGIIAMSQAQDGQIRFFTAEGEPLGTFGGRGQGPGEFQQPVRLGWQGDTLWVVDPELGRVSFISPSLELARIESHIPRILRLDESGSAHAGVTFSVTPYAPGPEGFLFAGLSPHRRGPPKPFTDYGTFCYLDPDGEVQRVILPLPNDPTAGPIRNRPRHDISPLAGRAAVALASLEGRDAGTFSLVSVDLEGDTVFARRYSFKGEAVSAHPVDRLLSFFRKERTAATGRGLMRSAGGPRILPPFALLLIGDDGSLWIRARLRDGRVPSYHVLAPNGEVIGTVSLPAGSRVAAARLDRIWVVDQDSLGVESVVRYGVEWN